MSDKIIENNQVTVIGEVVSEFTYSHEVFGEGFYMVDEFLEKEEGYTALVAGYVDEHLELFAEIV